MPYTEYMTKGNSHKTNCLHMTVLNKTTQVAQVARSNLILLWRHDNAFLCWRKYRQAQDNPPDLAQIIEQIGFVL